MAGSYYSMRVECDSMGTIDDNRNDNSSAVTEGEKS